MNTRTCYVLLKFKFQMEFSNRVGAFQLRSHSKLSLLYLLYELDIGTYVSELIYKSFVC